MIAYFFDRYSLQIKDIIKLSTHYIDLDEEVNNKSTLTIHKKPIASPNDFIVIKNNSKIEYSGIIPEILNENGYNMHTLNALHISNIFNRKLFLDNEVLISTVGIEDFIKLTIENEFSNSSDTFINLDYIQVNAHTHTMINKSIETQDGVYNFHTFITNSKQNYNINMDYKIDNGLLLIDIYKDVPDEQIIDTSFSDIIDYHEIREINYLAKATVRAKNTGLTSSWYLQADRSITTDQNSSSRVIGDTDVLMSENEEEMEQVALNAFKGNSYKHLVEFKLKKNSKLIDVEKLVLGTPIVLKTKSGGVFNSYISGKIIDSNSDAIYFKCGNLRVTLTDKLKKGVL